MKTHVDAEMPNPFYAFHAPKQSVTAIVSDSPSSFPPVFTSYSEFMAKKSSFRETSITFSESLICKFPPLHTADEEIDNI